VLPDVHGEFFSEIVRGMELAARARGYMLLLSNMHDGTPRAEAAVRAMRGRVDGLLVMAPHLDRATLERALPSATPVVLINARPDVASHANLRLDNASGVEAVVSHFLSIGRTRVAHICGPAENHDAQERLAAFREAMARSAPDRELIIVSGDFSEDAGRDAVRDLIAREIGFDGVLAANDMMAIGALQALGEAGLRVPADVAVAGFDDVPVARHLGLTTVRARVAELGERAVERLVAILGGATEEATQELHSTELVVRGTTARDTSQTALV
jgi:LacI family transcriptional regulator